MSIFRSGVLGAVQARCLLTLQESDYACEAGKVYDVISQMASMLMIRDDKGREILVPRSAFEIIPSEK